MAQQTKSKSSASSGSRSNRRKSPAKGRTAAKSRSGASRSKNPRTSPRKTRPRASSGQTKASSSKNKGPVEAAKDATTKGANTAGRAVIPTAKKLKTPAIATGTGLAGLAAGIALTRNRNRKCSESGCQVVAILGGRESLGERGEEHWRARRADRESGRTGARRKRGDRRGQRAPQVQVRDRGRPGGPYESFAIKGRLIGRCNSALVSSATTGAAVEVRPSPRSSGRSERRSAAPRDR